MKEETPEQRAQVIYGGAPREVRPMGSLTPKAAGELISTVVNQWMGALSPQEVERRVVALLDRNLDIMVGSALGFTTDSWSRKLEVDHCNGRASTINSLISERAKAAAQRWVEQHIADFEEKRKNDIPHALRREYDDVYGRALSEKLRELAVKRASQDAMTIIDVLGYDPGEIATFFQEHSVTGQPTTPEEIARQDGIWTTRGILSEAIFRGMVRIIDGDRITKDGIDVPGVEPWAVLILKSTIIRGAMAVIITDGTKWRPIGPTNVFENDAVDFKLAKVMKAFASKRELIFNYMNEADRQLIGRVLTSAMGGVIMPGPSPAPAKTV